MGGPDGGLSAMAGGNQENGSRMAEPDGQPHALWVQMSTIGEEATQRCEKLASEHGVGFVDAPVLGTRQPADEGKLVVLESGPEEARPRLQPLFDAIGQRTIRVGEAGGGTRLKIVEAMAMGKAIVSTTLGAEGIEAVSGRDIFIEDEPLAFAAAVNRLLENRSMAVRIGESARRLAVERYAWSGAAETLEGFYRRILEARS